LVGKYNGEKRRRENFRAIASGVIAAKFVPSASSGKSDRSQAYGFVNRAANF
jgi:hypothetical protein